MRIESINRFAPQLLPTDQLNLKEGSVVRGEILEQSADRVLLQLNNTVIDAMLEGVMQDLQGKVLNFLVSSDSQGKVVLKLHNTEEQIPPKDTIDSSFSKLFHELGVEKCQKTVDIVRNMMTFSIPIDKKNVQEMLNLQSKVEMLMNLKATDHVFLIKNSLEEIADLLSQSSECSELISWKEELLAKNSALGKIVKMALRQGFSQIEIFREISDAKSVSEAYRKVDQILKHFTDNDNMIPSTKEPSTSFPAQKLQKFFVEIDRTDVESVSQLNIENLSKSENNITKSLGIGVVEVKSVSQSNVANLLNSEKKIINTLITTETEDEFVSQLNIENLSKSEKNNTKSMEKDMMDVESVSHLNIENLFVSEKNLTKNMIDIRQSVQKFLENSPEILKKDLSRIFSFFKKHDLPLTLGNYKTMLQYLDRPDRLFQVFQKLDHVIKKNPELFSAYFSQVKERESTMQMQTSNLQDLLKSPEILRKVEEMYPDDEGWKENIRFILDLNKDLNFMFFPLNSDFYVRGGFIHYLKQQQQKKVDYQKTVNIMINVETHHIGNVRVFCKVNNKKLDIKLKIREENVPFFESNIESLKKSIEGLGYEIGSIKYIFDEKYSLLDLQIESATSSYFLDLRV